MRKIKHTIGELEVIQNADTGYVNATQLCKVYEAQAGIKKTPSHWFETDRANRFIEVVSCDTGIPVSQLFIVNKGNSLKYEQGTWIHPDLASPFASWLSPEYELMVSRWVQEWMRTGQNPIQSTSFKAEEHPAEASIATLREIEFLFRSIERLGIKPPLVESAKLTAVAKSIPRLKLAADEGKRLLSSQMTVEEIPMSPTQLGKILAKRLGLSEPFSAQKVNQALLNAGLQTNNKRTDSQGKVKMVWQLISNW